jgi:hypothetical protein
MKARLNLTIENKLLEEVKVYATKRQQSVSELVEGYFKTITKPSKRKNILDLIDKLEKPNLPKDTNLKDLYYSENAKKYGF